MTNFEDHVTELMEARAARTDIRLDLDAVTTNRPIRPVATRWTSTRSLLTVAAVSVLAVTGLALLARDRPIDPAPPASAPEASDDLYNGIPEAGPKINDHWHIAYGINLCGTWIQLDGDLEDLDSNGEFVIDAFVATGIHSHDDGIIHLHPFSEQGTGANARLGVFFNNYGIDVRDDGLAFGSERERQTGLLDYERCDDGGKQFVVIVWPDPAKPDEKVIVERGLAGVPLGADGMAIAIALTDDPDSVGLPPSASVELPNFEPGPTIGATDIAPPSPESHWDHAPMRR